MAITARKNTGGDRAPAGGEPSPPVEILDARLPATPLTDGEAMADYQAFHASCRRAAGPKDAIEEVWLQDFIDYTWEARRLRRMKASIVKSERKDAVKSLVQDCLDDTTSAYHEARSLTRAWSRSEKEGTARVEALLEEHGHDAGTIIAKAIHRNLDILERLDKLIASYEYRRDAALRELEKRRDLLAKRARRFADTVITDAEVEEILPAG